MTLLVEEEGNAEEAEGEEEDGEEEEWEEGSSEIDDTAEPLEDQVRPTKNPTGSCCSLRRLLTQAEIQKR